MKTCPHLFVLVSNNAPQDQPFVRRLWGNGFLSSNPGRAVPSGADPDFISHNPDGYKLLTVVKCWMH